MAKTQIKKIPWSENIDEKLSVSAGQDLALIRNEVRNKISELWICQSKKCTAYVVTRVEEKELVIVLFEGSGLMEFMPTFIDRAVELNMTIRAHIRRKGMLRFARRLNFDLSEYVMRFNHGQ